MSRMRLWVGLTLFALSIVAVGGPAAARGNHRPAADDGKYVALLPLTWLGVARADLPRPPVGPDRPVVGHIVLANGAEIVGGPVGQAITIGAELSATSPFGAVSEMRVTAATACADLPVDLAVPWAPFAAHHDFTYDIVVPNIVGFYAQAQFRDARGNVSPVVCDDVSVEGQLVPTATPSPTPEPLGRISGRLLVNGAPAVEGTGLAGPALWLRRCAGADCTIVARSGVLGSAGAFVFEHVAALPGGASYQVTWRNEDDGDLFGDNTLLGSWYGTPINRFDGSSELAVGDIELADIALTRPTHGTGFQGLPIHFEWLARPFDESYRWGIVRGCGLLATRAQALLTASLGHGAQYDLANYPPNVQFGNDNMYCWFVRVQTNTGYGESYYARMMWFIPPLLQSPNVR